MSLKTFTEAYIDALHFTERPEDEPERSRWDAAEFAPAALEGIKSACEAFYPFILLQISVLQGSPSMWDEQAGHDFWLTRNGHGAGFWDGDWPEPAATELTDAAHAAGEISAYLGDDGFIHLD
jgi:hypothetical protein